MSPEIDVDYERWGDPQRLSVPQFLALDRLHDGLVLIEEGGLELPMLVTNRGAPATFVGFHAAMNPGRRRPLPFFQGRRIAPRGLNAVLLSDPSLGLHPEVKVGWFLGCRRFTLRERLPAILDHVDRLTGARRRLLWGCSAGGTAALHYARDEDVAVAINPQTVIANFTRGRWQPWLEHGWGVTGRAAEQDWLAAHADLRREPPKGRVLYLQNARDDHVARHMQPLLQAMGLPAGEGEHGRVRVTLGNWGEGHAPPSSDEQMRILGTEAARLTGRPGWRERLFGVLRRR